MHRHAYLIVFFLSLFLAGCSGDGQTAPSSSQAAPPATLEGAWGGYFETPTGAREGLEFRLGAETPGVSAGHGWLFRGSRSLHGGRVTARNLGGGRLQLVLQLRRNHGTVEVDGVLGADDRVRGTYRVSQTGETGPIVLQRPTDTRPPGLRAGERVSALQAQDFEENFYQLQFQAAGVQVWYGLSFPGSRGSWSVAGGPMIGDDQPANVGSTEIQCLYFSPEWITFDFYDAGDSQVGSLVVRVDQLLYLSQDGFFAIPDSTVGSSSYLYLDGREFDVHTVSAGYFHSQTCYGSQWNNGEFCIDPAFVPYLPQLTLGHVSSDLDGTYTNVKVPQALVDCVNAVWNNHGTFFSEPQIQ